MKHPHAESMRLYAQDAMETDKPWERWEFCERGSWRTLADHPLWILRAEYRRKRKTININGYEVPEPVREPLEMCVTYFLPNLAAGPCKLYWNNDTSDTAWLAAGLIHLTPEDADLHKKALLSFTRMIK